MASSASRGHASLKRCLLSGSPFRDSSRASFAGLRLLSSGLLLCPLSFPIHTLCPLGISVINQVRSNMGVWGTQRPSSLGMLLPSSRAGCKKQIQTVDTRAMPWLCVAFSQPCSSLHPLTCQLAPSRPRLRDGNEAASEANVAKATESSFSVFMHPSQSRSLMDLTVTTSPLLRLITVKYN